MADGDYEWFITLAELQHVTSAAEQLHVAQPTLTRMLARLERQMGVSLFDRLGRRLSLNTYGRIFYEHARRAQLELDSARRAIDDLTNPAVSEIRLAFLSSFGSTVVPRLIARFGKSSPRVTFTLEEGAAELIGDRVQSGVVDIGVVSPRPRKRSLAWRSLFRQRLGGAESHDGRGPGRRRAWHQPGAHRRQRVRTRSACTATGRRRRLPRCGHDLGFRSTVVPLGPGLHRGRRGRGEPRGETPDNGVRVVAQTAI